MSDPSRWLGKEAVSRHKCESVSMCPPLHETTRNRLNFTYIYIKKTNFVKQQQQKEIKNDKHQSVIFVESNRNYSPMKMKSGIRREISSNYLLPTLAEFHNCFCFSMGISLKCCVLPCNNVIACLKLWKNEASALARE